MDHRFIICLSACPYLDLARGPVQLVVCTEFSFLSPSFLSSDRLQKRITFEDFVCIFTLDHLSKRTFMPVPNGLFIVLVSNFCLLLWFISSFRFFHFRWTRANGKNVSPKPLSDKCFPSKDKQKQTEMEAEARWARRDKTWMRQKCKQIWIYKKWKNFLILKNHLLVD